MSITTDNCIIVEGALSCGKTTLIEHLAEKNKQQLIKYQMDDFMDSKALIGKSFKLILNFLDPWYDSDESKELFCLLITNPSSE